MSTLQLPASVTLSNVTALLAQLDQSGDAPEAIDAAGLQEFDTGTIALLLEAHRRAKARGASFSVKNAPPRLRQLARIYGVEELLSLEPT